MYKSALTLSPTAVRTLQHAALGSGVGALGGAAAGALSADEGQRGRGALRGAALGGTIGGVAAGGGSYLSSLSAGKRINGLKGNLNNSRTMVNTLQQEAHQNTISAQQAASAHKSALKNMRESHQYTQHQLNDLVAAHPELQNEARALGERVLTPKHKSTPIPALKPALSTPPTPAPAPIPAPMPPPTLPSTGMPTGLPLSGSTPLSTPARRRGTVVGTPVEIPSAIKADRGVKPIPGQTPRTFDEQQRAGRLNQSPKLGSVYKEALEPWHAAVLGGLGNAALTGGLTAASQDERDWGQIARNAGIGGAVGAVGAGGLAHAAHGTGYALGNTNGYANGLAKGTFNVENILNDRLNNLPDQLKSVFLQHLGPNLIGMTP